MYGPMHTGEGNESCGISWKCREEFNVILVWRGIMEDDRIVFCFQ